ncbi:MAG TPA: helix-turn-helix domain-containing protein, partial [Miltoncostaeales bacterium]|nr:helix-turn-helix domain-containing protein [Miltoncostaeales bacterium]
MAEPKTRKRAEERREDILVAARAEFSEHGYEGASTDAIARLAGISQPYLFRLFGTKKDLFIAATSDCMDDVLKLFQSSAGNLRGEAALAALADVCVEWGPFSEAERSKALADLEPLAMGKLTTQRRVDVS